MDGDAEIGELSQWYADMIAIEATVREAMLALRRSLWLLFEIRFKTLERERQSD